jgi:hypothetical protein
MDEAKNAPDFHIIIYIHWVKIAPDGAGEERCILRDAGNTGTQNL